LLLLIERKPMISGHSTSMKLKCVWLQISCKILFFDGTLNGQNYLQVLRNDLECRSPHKTECMISTLPHNYRRVHRFLHERFLQKWIGRGEFVAWLSRSPDLSLLDFFWSLFKDCFCKPANNKRWYEGTNITNMLELLEICY